MGFWSKFGKIASIAAPIAAAPFTGGASLALIGAGSGALGGALGGGGWKGALTGAALGAIPGVGTSGGLAKGAVAPGLKAGLGQAAKTGAKQLALGAGTSAATKALPNNAGGNLARSLVPLGVSAGLGKVPGVGGGGGGFGGGGGGQGGNMASNIVPTGGGGQGFDWGKWGPIAGQVGGIAAGAIAGKKSQSNAMKRSPEEQQALAGAQGVAGNAARTAGGLIQQSQGMIAGPANYYSTLLHGSRAAMNQATAPGAKALTDIHRGEERSLSHAGIQGARRDVAAADISRRRASGIAGLTTGVQPAAAGALAELGTSTLQSAGPLYGTAGNLYGNLLQSGAGNRQYARKEGADTSRAIGGFVADIGKTTAGMWGKKTPGATGPEWLPQQESLPEPRSVGGGATPAARAQQPQQPQQAAGPVTGVTSPRPWQNIQFGGQPPQQSVPDWRRYAQY